MKHRRQLPIISNQTVTGKHPGYTNEDTERVAGIIIRGPSLSVICQNRYLNPVIVLVYSNTSIVIQLLSWKLKSLQLVGYVSVLIYSGDIMIRIWLVRLIDFDFELSHDIVLINSFLSNDSQSAGLTD